MIDDLKHEAHLTDVSWKYAYKVMDWWIVYTFDGNFKSLQHDNMQVSAWIPYDIPDGYLVSQAIEFGLMPHYAKILGEATCVRIIEARK